MARQSPTLRRPRLGRLARAGVLAWAAILLMGPLTARADAPETLFGATDPACKAVVNAIPAVPPGQISTSPNVHYIGNVPDEPPTATGGVLVGHYFYVTGWLSFSIYDVIDPLHPKLVSKTPVGCRFENEDVAGNDNTLIYTDFGTTQTFSVYDVSKKSAPSSAAVLGDGHGTHTAECLYNCQFAIGSYHLVGPGANPVRGGDVFDLRHAHDQPTGTVTSLGDWTADFLTKTRGDGQPFGHLPVHDVTEVAPGLLLTASQPMLLLKVSPDPTTSGDTSGLVHPQLLAQGTNYDRRLHTAIWPNGGTEKFILTSYETNAHPVCDSSSGEFATWDATHWQKDGTFTPVDAYRASPGTLTRSTSWGARPTGSRPVPAT
ncbi:MAG: hypothetical protein JF887_02655 [Candidatus Dormibacteraeota bacterium]|uniref:Secreted protein n=1 Tax=Candidatus Amunia macphersoniae TaxID=3127014 RepID=A0A934KLV2_9BACT|nr:hypothetical protein [Candidatus Dormibacteraeota bacterium]